MIIRDVSWHLLKRGSEPEIRHTGVPFKKPVHKDKACNYMDTYEVTFLWQEVDDFIDQMEKMYGLDMQRLDGPMKPALETVFSKDQPLMGCFLGTRNGDPGANKQGEEWYFDTFALD